jgi:undecaprenyl-diphosphatase
MTREGEIVRDRVRALLEEHLARVGSVELATAAVEHMLKLADGSEAERTQGIRRQRASTMTHIADATRGRSEGARVAALLVETAAQSLGSTNDAHKVAKAAYSALGSSTDHLSSAVRGGRSRLRDAVASSMQMPEALEAKVFLAIAGLPHPTPVRGLCEAVGFLATGGWIWVGGALIAHLLRVERSDSALKRVAPVVAAAAFISEGPAKVFFARYRPFRQVVRMMLLGVKPRARSFPSGHAATSLAAAWTLGSVWPERRPGLLGIATLISLSRVYLGAHDPSEILAGGVLGIALAELLRRPTETLLADIDLPESPLK